MSKFLVSYIILAVCVFRSVSTVDFYSKKSLDSSKQSEKDKHTITGLDGSQLFRKYYYELNDQLEQNEQSSELEANVKVASDLYDFPRKSKLGNDEQFIDSLRLFMSLVTLNSHNMCTDYSAYVLKNNYLAAFGYPWWGFEVKLAKRRINLIIGRLARFHASTCPNTYLAKYDQVISSKLVESGSSSMKIVEKLFMSLLIRDVNETRAGKIWLNADELFKYHFTFFKIVEDVDYTSEMLVDLTKNDTDAIYLKPVKVEGEQTNKFSSIPVMNREKFHSLVERHLVEPCKNYMQLFTDLFEPADFDSRFQIEIKNERLQYYQDWAKYRYCRSLVRGSHVLVNQYISYANKLSKEEARGKRFFK